MVVLTAILATTTTFQTLITPAPKIDLSSTSVSPAIVNHLELLRPRANGAVICGDLQSRYPNAQAPICSGTYSVCTFTNQRQGCCDGSGNCQFYNTCINHYATESCGQGCLACPASNIICYRYEFGTGVNAYLGFSCGNLPELDGSTIYGVTGSVTGATITSTISGTSTTSSASKSSGSSSPASTSNSSGQVAGASATTSPTTSSSPAPSKSGLSKGAIAGIVIAAVLGIIIIAVAIYCIVKRRGKTSGGKKHAYNPQPQVPMLQQHNRGR